MTDGREARGDDALTEARRVTGAHSAVLILLHGRAMHDAIETVVHALPGAMRDLPEILRDIAAEIESALPHASAAAQLN